MTSYPDAQNNPLGAIPSYNAGALPLTLSAEGYVQVKSSPGVYYGLNVNTGGTTSTLEVFDGLSSVVTMTKATPGVISWPNHGLPAGSAVVFETTGALYTGLTAGTTYYVANDANLTANTFAVSDTQAHALAGTNQIATSGTELGVQTGWNVSTPLGTFATTSTGVVNVAGTMGVLALLGLIALAAGAAPANITLYYR